MRAPPPELTAAARAAQTPYGDDWCDKTLVLETLTPMTGGGAQCQVLGPESDSIRAPSVRGQLRGWWRARHAAEYASPANLYQAERAIWGGTSASADEAFASKVQVSVLVEAGTARKDTDTLDWKHADFYVLWPLGMNQQIPRWKPGLRFELRLRFPKSHDEEIRNALRDWVLFGGVGGRTRRGCGALSVVTADDREWLRLPTREALGELGQLTTADAHHAGVHIPNLVGASLVVGAPSPAASALTVWRTAYRWMQDFRQGAKMGQDKGDRGSFARERPSWSSQGRGAADRAGRSRWPEPDKIRLAYQAPPGGWQHPPREGVSEKPAWPRASFGLPIQIQFQARDRRSQPYPNPEPRGNGPKGTHILGWTDGERRTTRDRLPSPLIVKPLQLADGRLIPIALWLTRQLPHGAKVGLVHGDQLQRGTEADFDLVRAPGDTDFFTALEGKDSPRAAFLDWCRTQGRTVIAL